MPRMKSDIGPWSLVPEWITDADVSDRALRLYVVLGRYADQDGRCWPKRSTLATRLRCSLDSLDRAKNELVVAGALTWEQTIGGSGSLTSNEYVLRYLPPDTEGGGRVAAARGSRVGAARGGRVAAAVIENESQLELDPATQGSNGAAVAPEPGIHDLVSGYVDDVRAVENGHEPTRRWKAAAGRACRAAFDDGESAEVIATCLGIVAREGKNPSTLPHIISDYHAKRPRRTPRP